MRALDAAGVDATDIHRREATLDDVFLALTGDHGDARPARHGGLRLMSTIAPTPAPGFATRLRWGVSDTLAFAGRNLEHVRQIPEKLIDVTLQPLMFVLLFAYVFGGVIDIPDGSYRSTCSAGSSCRR